MKVVTTTMKKTNGMSLNVLGVKVLEFVENVMETDWMRMIENAILVMDQPFVLIVTVLEKSGFNKAPYTITSYLTTLLFVENKKQSD